jgi:sporulation protein YlmC with PRC-barrel domain
MRIKVLSLAAILGIGMSTGLQAQDNNKAGSGDQGKIRTEIRERLTDHDKGNKFNRASKLIGMNVKNAQGQNLGEIQDLVVDMQSGRISYAVLGTGGILGVGEKYMAIPSSAFEYSADGNVLVLNADKAKIDQAPGFTKDNWPDVENPAWGAYWGVNANSDGINAQGNLRTPGSDESRGNLNKRNDDLRGNTDRNNQQYKSSDQSRDSDRQTGRNLLDRQTLSGKIMSLNTDSRTMTVQTDQGTQVLSIDQTATVKGKGAPNGKLSDLKVGDQVTVRMKKQGDGGGTVSFIEKNDSSTNLPK